MGALIGKIFKSKINGKVFRVEELHGHDHPYYKVRALPSGELLTVDKRLFEEMCLSNLEQIGEEK